MDTLHANLKHAMETLRWYADAKNYDKSAAPGHLETWTSPTGTEPPEQEWILDQGKNARDTLEMISSCMP